MNRLLVALGLISAVFSVISYACYAVRIKKKPDLATGLHIALAAAAIPAAVRLIGFPFTSDFHKLTAAADTSWWSVSGEDGLFIVLGGIAIAWVSVQIIWDGFEKL
jgi:hypothetical protein